MYAIRHKDTFRWYYGTDKKYTPPRTKSSRQMVKLYNRRTEAEADLPDDDYEVVLISITPLDERRKYDNRPVSL